MIAAGAYCTYTQGGWHNPQNSSGGALKTYFGSVYVGGSVTVGQPCTTTTYSMSFNSAKAVQAYLPAGGAPGRLNRCLVNPLTSSSMVFGGQVLTLELNVDFNNAGIIAGTNGSISGLTLCGTQTSLDGKTIAQVLAAANNTLGGGPLPGGIDSVSQFNDLITSINGAFDSCKVSSYVPGHLVKGLCP